MSTHTIVELPESVVHAEWVMSQNFVKSESALTVFPVRATIAVWVNRLIQRRKKINGMSIYLQIIGAFANWVLYGVLLCQICKCLERCSSVYGLTFCQYLGLYYTAFPTDHRLLKQTVLLAFVLETVQTAMFTQHVFRRFTRDFEDPLAAAEVGSIWFSVPLMTGLSMFNINTTMKYSR